MDVIVAFGTLKTAALEGNRNPYGDGPRPLCKDFLQSLFISYKC
jgi:DNA ligase-4